MPVNSKITLEILECYLSCKYKAYLRFAEQQGTKSDYEVMQIEARREVRAKAMEKIHYKYPELARAEGTTLTRDQLRTGAPFILDADLQDDHLSVHFDGLKKVDGHSVLGDFHYVPVLLYEGRQIRAVQRLLLEVLGLLLSRVQAAAPNRGVIFHGSACTATTVRFAHGLQGAQELLDEVIRMQHSKEIPKLLLNDHCQVCEFRRQCHAQAIKEDNLSLLRGMGEKEVRTYAR